MRSILLCFFCGLLTLGIKAKPYPSDSLTLVQAFDSLSHKYKVKFAFDHSALDQDQLVWWNSTLGLTESLDELLTDVLYRYEVQDDVVLIIPDQSSIRKNMAVTGVVVDGESGEPLPHAMIRLPGSGKYTTTNQNGKFSFVNVPYDTSTIQVHYLGYKPKHVTPRNYKNGTQINIPMSVSTEYLDDVVIDELAYKVVEINQDPSHFSLDLKEFNGITNFGEPDVFRSVQLLPGVSATNETSAGLVIRGGTPEQNLVLFDGFTVYHLDHFFGIYSAFNSNVIKDVQMYKSGYGAKWGTRVSGVMDITGKSGNSHKLSGNIGANLVSANAALEIPVSSKTSVVLAGRRAYTDVIQSRLYKKLFDHLQSNDLKRTLIATENISDQPVESDFYFYDLNAKVTHQLSDRDVIQASYYQGRDNLKQSNFFFYEVDEPEYYLSERIDTQEHTQWGNSGGSVTYSRQWNDQWYSRAIFSGSSFFRDQDYLQQYEFYYDSLEEVDSYDYEFSFRNENLINEYNLGLDVEYKISDSHILDVGLFSVSSEVKYQNFYNESLEETDLDIQESGSVNGLFAQYSFIPTSKLRFIGGLRLTDYSITQKLYLEPRLSFIYKPKTDITLKTSFGRYYQFVSSVSSIDPTLNGGNFWLLSGANDIPLLESYHYVLGFNINSHLFELDVEGYYKKTDGLTNYTLVQSSSGDIDELFSTGEGKTYGVDIMIKKNIRAYTGWLAYTLSENQNRYQGINTNEWYPSDFDERHEVKWVNLINVKKWEFSVTWIYGSGKPYSVNPSGVPIDTVQVDLTTNIDNPNTKRMPAYHKMDIGISYVQKLKIGKLRYGLNLLNIYNRRNIKSIREYPLSGTTTGDANSPVFTQRVELLGFTPSIFINLSF